MMQHTYMALPHEGQGKLSLYHWQETPSDRPVLHWAHANGFNGHTYQPLLTPLADKFDLYAWDARGHGFTDWAADPARMSGWDIYAHDLISLLEILADRHGKKIWLGGHSMGGCTSVLAAAQRPDLIAGLVLTDPVITPKLTWFTKLAMKISKRGGSPLAEMAKKRRADWPDTATVKKAYTGRGAFATWDEPFFGCVFARRLTDAKKTASDWPVRRIGKRPISKARNWTAKNISAGSPCRSRF